MTIDFYYMGLSPPCRAVLLVAKALGVPLNLKTIDLMKGEHLTPEFIKLNPQHTVPVLVDDGLVLSESRAITSYLVEQYGKNDSLYPKDPQKRALVDQRLYFDIGTLVQSLGQYIVPVLVGGQQPDKTKAVKIDEALAHLNNFLAGQRYVAGIQKTIADIALAVSVSHAESVGINISKHANVVSWYKRMKSEIAGFEELNDKPAIQFAGFFKSKLTKKQ